MDSILFVAAAGRDPANMDASHSVLLRSSLSELVVAQANGHRFSSLSQGAIELPVSFCTEPPARLDH